MPEADEACCNLAEEIVDGCQIYIMTKSESCADGQTEKKAGIQTSPDSDMQTTDRNVRSNSAPALENGLVNLNTADVAALMTLPGIGESRAKAIISYREQHGAFAQIEDIMKSAESSRLHFQNQRQNYSLIIDRKNPDKQRETDCPVGKREKHGKESFGCGR